MNYSLKTFWSRLPAYLLVYGWSAFSITGLLYVVFGSFKTRKELIRHTWELPQSWDLINYINAWENAHFAAYLLNSLITVSIAVLLIVFIATPAAYVLTRAKFKLRNVLSGYIIIGMGIPIPLLYIPLFVIMAYLRLNDTLTGLTIVFVVVSLPFSVYMLTGFFSTIPLALLEAARIDGCSSWQAFCRVMFPLAKNGIYTVSVFNFIWLWNEYQLSLVLLTSSENYTLPMGLYALQNAMQYTGDWPGLFAGVTIVMIPTIVMFIFLSEKLISGITAGSVK